MFSVLLLLRSSFFKSKTQASKKFQWVRLLSVKFSDQSMMSKSHVVEGLRHHTKSRSMITCVWIPALITRYSGAWNSSTGEMETGGSRVTGFCLPMSQRAKSWASSSVRNPVSENKVKHLTKMQLCTLAQTDVATTPLLALSVTDVSRSLLW